jgi:eukaryotic-like serine/threonine-protein kinase
MNRIRHLIHEVHRRSIWQVLGIYLVGAWLAYQVILGLTDGLGLPAWVPPLAVVLFLVGLPMVLATAIVQEGPPAPADLRRTNDVAPGYAAPAAPSAPSAPPALEPGPNAGGARTLLTWPRTLRAGLLAFALLGVGTAAWLAARSLGIGPAASLMAAGVVEPNSRILIADFGSSSGDSTLAAVVTEAFRIDFARSRVVQPVPPDRVREVLQRMGREDVVRLDPDLAREVALRAGVAALITGSVTSAGGGYVLSAQVVLAETGEVVAAVRETARDSTQIIDGIDRLSSALRERIGESLRTIRRAEPLELVTTGSLEALRRFTDARRAQGWEGDNRKARRLLVEAVELDSAFAAAWRSIAVHDFNAENYAAAHDAIERALMHRHRLSDDERAHALATYHVIRREYRDVIAVIEPHVDRRPDDLNALTILGVAYKALGDFEQSNRWMRRAAEAEAQRFFGWANLGEGFVLQGRLEEAAQTFDHATKLATADPSWPAVHRAYLPWVAGDADAAEAALRALIADTAASRNMQDRARIRLAAVMAARGRAEERDRLLRSTLLVSPAALEAGNSLREVNRQLFLFGNPDRARAAIRAFEQAHGASATPEQLARLAEACAWLNDPPCARERLERSGHAGALAAHAPFAVIAAHAALAAAEGDPRRAVSLYRTSASWRCLACSEAMVGRVFERAGQPDSALAAYRRFAETPSMHRFYEDHDLVPALERLAALHEARGDRAAAAGAYTRIVDLWRDADAPLQPRVATARARLTALMADRAETTSR